MEKNTRTLLCSDLFTQGGGADLPAVTEADILGPSEALRQAMDYYSHSPSTRATLEKLASAEPTTLACMHGSTWQGDGAKLLRALADLVSPSLILRHPGLLEQDRNRNLNSRSHHRHPW